LVEVLEQAFDDARGLGAGEMMEPDGQRLVLMVGDEIARLRPDGLGEGARFLGVGEVRPEDGADR
jgi:hypothetical protein